jgi:hypothetical protein
LTLVTLRSCVREVTRIAARCRTAGFDIVIGNAAAVARLGSGAARGAAGSRRSTARDRSAGSAGPGAADIRPSDAADAHAAGSAAAHVHAARSATAAPGFGSATAALAAGTRRPAGVREFVIRVVVGTGGETERSDDRCGEKAKSGRHDFEGITGREIPDLARLLPRLLNDRTAVDERCNRRIDSEIRFGCVAFGEKEIERVGVSGRDAELRRLCVEVDLSVFGAVNTAQIDS